ncbi:MAG: RIP metalloprotease RseP [Blastocatellia bacterium]
MTFLTLFLLSAGTIKGFIAFILVLCAMIVIHEFGHFIVAKMLGIAVETFSVGFGRRLFWFQIGDTEYRLSAIPLGGYVKFRGENMELLQGVSKGSVEEFLAHPKWKRFLVAVAGPVFNIVTAILIPTAAILIGFQDDVYNSQKVVIGEVTAGSTAEQSGLQQGDRIVKFGSKQNPTWADFRDKVVTNLGEDIPVTIERNGQLLDLKLRPRVETRGAEPVGVVDLDPAISYVGVGGVKGNSPAERAGLKLGDKITAINGTPVNGWHQFRRFVQEGREVNLSVARGQETLNIKATPEKTDEGYLLGFSRRFETRMMKTSSLTEALQYGWNFNLRILELTGELFKQIFSLKRSARDSIGGPIRIAEATIDTYEVAGWAGVIGLMGLLSLNLGIFNLLPIPVLDGGVILLIFIEWIMGLLGLTLTMNIRERFQQVGFVMVLLLMGFVIINDVVGVGQRFFSKPPAQEQQVQPKK